MTGFYEVSAFGGIITLDDEFKYYLIEEKVSGATIDEEE